MSRARRRGVLPARARAPACWSCCAAPASTPGSPTPTRSTPGVAAARAPSRSTPRRSAPPTSSPRSTRRSDASSPTSPRPTSCCSAASTPTASCPGFDERFGLRAAAVAIYPMYRGIARLLGMDVLGRPADLTEQLADPARRVGRLRLLLPAPQVHRLRGRRRRPRPQDRRDRAARRGGARAARARHPT